MNTKEKIIALIKRCDDNRALRIIYQFIAGLLSGN